MVYSNASSLRRWQTNVPKTILTSVCRQGFLLGGREKADQRNREAVVLKVSAVSSDDYPEIGQPMSSFYGGESASLLEPEHLVAGVSCL